ncbi:MAG: hypothetical protein P8O93_07750 [Flavobacteriaceae bacterium]|jgi:hypothetical protein|nr:hypothetical protein [Flavobacteriaceae bacterium]MDG1962981.1 hypothetical protein [Flavobacteriaceae bacterium]
MRTFFLTIFLVSTMSIGAQVDDFHQEIMDMMTIKGDAISGSVAFYDVFPKLKRNFKSKAIAPEVWQQMKGDEKQQVNLYLDQAAYAYREYFDQAGIQKLTEFYLSETGQAYAFGEQMTSDQKSNLTKFLATETGQNWMSHKTEIEENIAEARKDWTAQVFKDKMKMLIKQGHLN